MEATLEEKREASKMVARDGLLIAAIDSYARYIHDWAREKGFWDEEPRNKGEMIALTHSELSEMLEGIRHGNPPSEHIPEFTAEEEEAADTVIRILDYSAGHGLRLGEAIVAKMAFNAGRPYKHGKSF